MTTNLSTPELSSVSKLMLSVISCKFFVFITFSLINLLKSYFRLVLGRPLSLDHKNVPPKIVQKVPSLTKKKEPWLDILVGPKHYQF